VSEIAVYIEGGGHTVHLQAELRRGFDALLRNEKERARENRRSLKLVCCGGRQETYRAFKNEIAINPAAVCVLLVDSETSLPAVPHERAQDAELRRDHLQRREATEGRGQGDGWDLSGVAPDRIHLMVQCMEAWVVADPEALEAFYKQGFRKGRLPQRPNLEEELKADVYAKLEAATENSAKGKYAKIRHASQLLQRINPEKVERRCPRFSVLRGWLSEQIGASAQ